MSAAVRGHLSRFAVGGVLGLVLSQVGFTDFRRVQGMFTLSEPQLWLVFAGAVGLGMLTFLVVFRRHGFGPRRVRATTVPGGLLFGLGWALCGACPAAALAQIGERKLAGAVVTAGIFLGTWLFAKGQGRLWRVPGSCVDD